MAWELDKIRALVDLATQKDLAELSVEDGDQKLTIKTAAAMKSAQPSYMIGHAPVANPMGNPSGRDAIVAPGSEHPALPDASRDGSPNGQSETSVDSSIHVVTSPMVGTFYSAASPDSPPYVSVGSSVREGQTLCILEAMKQMNELESDVSGIVQEVMVTNGEPIEFGQPLFRIKL